MTKGEIDALIAEARGNIRMMVRDEDKWPTELTANYRRLADALSLLGDGAGGKGNALEVAANAYRAAHEAHNEASMTQRAGFSRSHLIALAEAEWTASHALLTVARSTLRSSPIGALASTANVDGAHDMHTKPSEPRS